MPDHSLDQDCARSAGDIRAYLSDYTNRGGGEKKDELGHSGRQTAFPRRLVGPDLYGSRFERIHMNHPSTSLRNESPAYLLTL